jgi:hypothetical protein
MLDELDDVVQGKPRFQIAKITGCYLERLPSRSAAPADQPAAQCFIYNLAERPTGAAGLYLELCRHIVI